MSDSRKRFAENDILELLDHIETVRLALYAIRPDWEEDTVMEGLITCALNKMGDAKSDLEDIVTRMKKRPQRYTKCHCCGAGFYTNKPPDRERDVGFGTCTDCHERVAKSWVKHGFPGERPITMEQALARLRMYA